MAEHPAQPLSPPRDERRFVPQFILYQCEMGEYSGRFSAAGVFFDLSGFTHLTESLMSHGAYGAEALAAGVESVFAPWSIQCFPMPVS